MSTSHSEEVSSSLTLTPNQPHVRIALSGGPGGGKTTAADLFRREIGPRAIVVPEAATMLFCGGFPRYSNPDAIRKTQQAIFHVQRHIEEVQAAAFPDRFLLCDRGTVDGGAYWPDGGDDFFRSLGSSLDQELARYGGVVFFETAAAGDASIEGGNPARIESLAEARLLDKRLQALWSRHPNYVFVPHEPSFLRKVGIGLKHIIRMVQELARTPSPASSGR